tara:strand:+ start:818 stop:1102 length:285 start_codon:yes stop_codon:yes gene_type:complete
LFEKLITAIDGFSRATIHRLKVQAKIQDILTIEPMMTTWAANKAPNAKRVSCIVNRTKPIQVRSVSSSRIASLEVSAISWHFFGSILSFERVHG